MPTFDFTTSTSVTGTGSSFTINFTDTSSGSPVNFTLSTSGNSGVLNAQFSVVNQISITDTVAGGAFVLALNPTQSLNNIGPTGAGSVTLNLGTYVSGTWNITLVHETNTALNLITTVSAGAAGAAISVPTTENYSEVRFTATGAGSNAITIDSVTAAITCYLEGTGIATPTGRVAVETLQPGDEILTADGGITTVRWLGVQPIDTRTVTPSKANPICFTAGSIAPNVPSRDLFVSPDHAMEIDGILYNATALVNGRSIYQVAQMPMDGFTYYHIDTGAHELVLAEGAASETYLDAVGRDAFVNGHEQVGAPIITEMSVPRIVANRMVPQDVERALSERADELGLTSRQKVA